MGFDTAGQRGGTHGRTDTSLGREALGLGGGSKEMLYAIGAVEEGGGAVGGGEVVVVGSCQGEDVVRSAKSGRRLT